MLESLFNKVAGRNDLQDGMMKIKMVEFIKKKFYWQAGEISNPLVRCIKC